MRTRTAPHRADTEEIQRVSLVDNVADRLRTAIINGEFQPDEKVQVRALERRFGVSHIPIREALRRLESEGLVIATPQRSTVVAGVALEDLAGLYDLRRLIEVPVARRAVAGYTDDEVVEVRRRFQDLIRAAEDTSGAPFWEAHNAFHWAILAPGAGLWVRKSLDQLWQAAERYVRLFLWVGSIEQPMREHAEIVEGCEARDAERVAKALHEHLDHTERTVRDAFLARQTSARIDSVSTSSDQGATVHTGNQAMPR